MRVVAVFACLGAAFAEIDYLTSSSSTTASSSSSSSSSSTSKDTLSVWTTTYISGSSSAYQVAFTQSFAALWTTVATPSSGTIGLGSIQGTVGTYRSDGAVEPRSNSTAQ